MSKYATDLVVLVADIDMELSINGILSRRQSLNIRQITFDIFRHPERDPGCFVYGQDFLVSFLNSHAHGLVFFDKEGCGQEGLTLEKIEKTVDSKLSKSGWGDRAKAIVINPELENWVWSDSPHVASCLGWKNQEIYIRKWLEEKKLWEEKKPKPNRPKEAMELVLREVKKPRSSSIYQDLAGRVGLGKCQDKAFLKLKNILHQWFPQR